MLKQQHRKYKLNGERGTTMKIPPSSCESGQPLSLCLCIRIQSTMRTCTGGRGTVRVAVGRAVEQFLNDGGMVLEVGSGNETNLETLRVAC